MGQGPKTLWLSPAENRRGKRTKAKACLLNARSFFLFEGMIRRSDQWPSFHVFKPHRFAEPLIFCKFIWMDVPFDGQMFRSRLQILSQRKNMRSLRRDFLHRLQHFFARFAQT